jgi:dihydrofolate reductase
MTPDEELHRHFAAGLDRADALLFGRVTYEMMESAWRQPATGTWPDWMGATGPAESRPEGRLPLGAGSGARAGAVGP